MIREAMLVRLHRSGSRLTDPCDRYRGAPADQSVCRGETCSTFDGFAVCCHPIADVSDHLGVAATTTGPTELPHLNSCPMIVMDGLVDGAGVDLAATVAFDRAHNVVDELAQSRLVITGDCIFNLRALVRFQLPPTTSSRRGNTRVLT